MFFELFFFFSYYACSDASSNNAGRILFGEDGSIDAYPFFGLLVQKQENVYSPLEHGPTIQVRCGGAFITPRHFLSAFHCIYEVEHLKWAIITGVGNICDPEEKGKQYDVEELIIHPESNIRDMIVADIVIARIAESVTDIIGLPSSDIVIGMTGTIIGFGLAKNTENILYRPCVIQQVERYVPDQAECIAPTTGRIEGAFCTKGLSEKLSASCKGDSGGPLFTDDENGNKVIFGISSFGDQSCNMNNANDYYTNVYHYMPWIMSSITTE